MKTHAKNQIRKEQVQTKFSQKFIYFCVLKIMVKWCHLFHPGYFDIDHTSRKSGRHHHAHDRESRSRSRERVTGKSPDKAGKGKGPGSKSKVPNKSALGGKTATQTKTKGMHTNCKPHALAHLLMGPWDRKGQPHVTNTHDARSYPWENLSL